MAGSLGEYLDQIQQNWHQNDGPCKQCPARDRDGQWGPVFGRGDGDADVVCIGIDPGGNNEPKRDKRDYGKSQWSKRDETHTQNKVLPPAREAEVFFNRLSCYTKEKPSECGVYFTNLKKCNEIHDSQWQKDNRAPATHCCTSYTTGELARLSPKVVISFKTPVLRWLLNHHYAIDYSENISTTANIVLESTWKKEGVTIVPSYHFSGAPRGKALNALTNRGKIDLDVDKPQIRYWEKLADQVNSILSNSA